MSHVEKKHPYSNLPKRCFWRSAIGERHYAEIDEICAPIHLKLEQRIATGGSCFAQHIGRHLKNKGAHYLDFEPAPDFLAAKDIARFGYGLYSCRYGNIYTSRQLLQLMQEALGLRQPDEIVWSGQHNRFYDALRPSVDPVGFASQQEVLNLRKLHLAAVKKMFESLDIFVFTLGLTEAWMQLSDDTVYPTAPGVIAGEYDNRKYKFANLRYHDVGDDLQTFFSLLRSINPNAKLLLTVSPVPLAATASGEHVLVATTRSKSVLRAVAGDLAEDNADIEYFPSYELINGHSSRYSFFNPDLRTVNDFGVQYVMSHFFQAIGTQYSRTEPGGDGVICDEGALDKFAV